jgi:cadmium resistance transport/sequestration family protein
VADVEHLLATISASVGVFAGTNVDDIVVLTVLFLASRASGRPKVWQLWAGQYVGIALLVCASGAAAFGMTIVPDRWVGLLGLVPLGLGVWGLLKAVRQGRGDSHGDERSPMVASGMLSVVWLTIANGADNISVYTPMFRTIGLAGSLVTVAVFAVMIAVWCAVGSWLGSHKRVIAVVERYGHWIVPAVFILIGALIVFESRLWEHARANIKNCSRRNSLCCSGSRSDLLPAPAHALS